MERKQMKVFSRRDVNLSWSCPSTKHEDGHFFLPFLELMSCTRASLKEVVVDDVVVAYIN